MPGLTALITNGASSFLHGNPQTSVYSTDWLRHTNSSFSFGEAPVNDEGRAVIPACDLLGECYLEFLLPRDSEDLSYPLSPRHLIERCAFSAGGKTYETFTGEAIEMAASRMERQFDGKYVRIIVPLPFFFCGSPHTYFHVAAPGASIDVAFCRTTVCDAHIVFKLVHLDSVERRDVADRQRNSLLCLTDTFASVVKDTSPGVLRVDLPFDGRMKDLRIMVREQGGGRRVAFVRSIDVLFNGHLHMSVSGLMASRAIPRRYGEEADNGVLHIPFCDDPSREAATSHVYFERIDTRTLLIHVGYPGAYEVTVLGRRWEVST